MNVNTYDATSLYDEVVSVPKLRVFDDGTGFVPLWFEVAPDEFVCADDLEEAKRERSHFTQGATLAFLKKAYPSGTLTTE